MSISKVKWAYEQDLPPLLKLTLIVMADATPDEGGCWLSNAQLAGRTGMSIRTVQRTRRDLENRGIVSKAGAMDPITGSIPIYLVGPDMSIEPVDKSAKGGVSHSHPPVRAGQKSPPVTPKLNILNKPSLARRKSKPVDNSKKWALPDGIDGEVWREFEAHRREIRKPLTDMARTKAANVLQGLNREQQARVVDYSIAGRYTGLFRERADPPRGRTVELPGSKRVRHISERELAKFARPGESMEQAMQRLSRSE